MATVVLGRSMGETAMAKDVPYVTRADIAEYLRLEDRRKALMREANDLKKQSDALAEKMKAFVRSTAGKEQSVLRSGFVLAIRLVQGSVSWKQKFIERLGVKEAEKLVQAAPKREVLTVQKAA